MARVDIPQPRAIITETTTGLLVTIPANRKWFVVLFVGFWMCGWLFGECSVIIMLARAKTPLPANLFMLAWLGGWTVGGAFAGYQWLWNVAGKELIALREDTLAIKSDVLSFGRVREFDLAEVHDLRIDRPSGLSMFSGDRRGGLPGQPFGNGTIAFDYGAKTFRFALGLDESEARQLVARLNSRHPFQTASAE